MWEVGGIYWCFSIVYCVIEGHIFRWHYLHRAAPTAGAPVQLANLGFFLPKIFKEDNGVLIPFNS